MVWLGAFRFDLFDLEYVLAIALLFQESSTTTGGEFHPFVDDANSTTRQYLNEQPLAYRYGENRKGVQIAVTNSDSIPDSAVWMLDGDGSHDLSAFSGHPGVVVQDPDVSTTVDLQYSWPNPFAAPLPVGAYQGYFVQTFPDGTTQATNSVYIICEPA